jgi:hypothetical protein
LCSNAGRPGRIKLRRTAEPERPDIVILRVA